MFSFWGVDALKSDTVLGVGVIEDGNGVAIGDFDDLAGEGVGRCRYGEKYEAANSGVDGLVMNPAGFNYAGYAL